MIDSALAEALANDPQALRAFVTGERRLPEPVNAALAAAPAETALEEEAFEEMTFEAAPPGPETALAVEKPGDSPGLARPPDMAVHLRTLQMLDALAPAPRRLLDILV